MLNEKKVPHVPTTSISEFSCVLLGNRFMLKCS